MTTTKNKYFYFAIILLSSFLLKGQIQESLIANETKWVNVPQFADMLADSSYQLMIDSFLQNPQQFIFTPNVEKQIFRAPNEVYWLHFTTRNDDKLTTHQFFMANKREIENIHLFLVKNDNHIGDSLHSGAYMPNMQRPYLPTQFWLLVFFIAIVLIVLSYRIRKKLTDQQRQTIEFQEKAIHQRQRISQDLHDDVGSTLNSIAVFSELAKLQIQSLNPQAVPLLDRISLSAQELMESISDIVWAVNPQNDKFEDIVLKMRFFTAELLVRKNINIDFVTEDCLGIVNLSLDKRKNFYLIFKEAVNNIYKYAECTSLYIGINQNADFICMTIADNGQGFDSQYGKIGNGLTSMRNRATELGGYLIINSISEKGTTLYLSFPIHDTVDDKKLPNDVGASKSNKLLF